jgi:hypothetical protein
VDDLVRSRRLLLIVTLAACSPASCGRASRATREPVGVSNGGAIEHTSEAEAGTSAPPLAGLPPDFRSTWSRIGMHVASEHGRFTADVYRDHEAWAEELFLADASAGVYLLERGDAGIRFAVADERGRTVADGDAGVESCTRCHSGARDWVFDVHQ